MESPERVESLKSSPAARGLRSGGEVRQTEGPNNSLAIPGGVWPVPDEGIDASGATQGRKGDQG